MSVSQDGSESVDQFLARIASIKEGRDQASEERTRRMEEDFLKNRKERQARRLERARSLSPSKTGPSTISSTSHKPTLSRDAALNPPVDFSPGASGLSRSNAQSAKTSPKLEPRQPDPNVSLEAPTKPAPPSNASGLARSGTLSWQQRPPHDRGLGRPRPLSSIDLIRPLSQPGSEQGGDQAEHSRQEIAATLGSKDASWFRQTQERGQGSAAFRKNQVEDTSVVTHATKSQVLPGMSRDNPVKTDRASPSTPERSLPSHEHQTPSVSRDESKREVSQAPETLSATRRTEPVSRPTEPSEPQPDLVSDNGFRSHVLTGRSPSPTKGLGGFVESAMMKRSDSVSKRWSVQASAGLKRGDSVAGVRPLGGARAMHVSSMSRDGGRGTSPSPAATSRPESRSGDADATTSTTAPPSKKTDTDQNGETKSRPITDPTPSSSQTPPTETHLSRSPSKTLDPRRWSPTKSSWLENALLSRPEPPRLQRAREEVPAWKASLQRNRASKDLTQEGNSSESRDTSNSTPQELGNIKSAPPVTSTLGSKPFSRKDILSLINAEDNTAKNTVEDKGDQQPPKKSPEVQQPSSPTNEMKPNDTLKLEVLNSSENPLKKTAAETSAAKRFPPVLRPKPETPPKTDFRSSLKSRAVASSGENETEPEFKAVFGKLKRAHTQNYVAPDTFKTNILQGKAALNTTGGPQKSERVDEFKESILQKKESMKVSAAQKKEYPPEPRSTKPEAVVPEALARRKTLSKAAAPPMFKSQNASELSSKTSTEQPKSAQSPKPKPMDSQANKPDDIEQQDPSPVELRKANVSSPSPPKTNSSQVTSIPASMAKPTAISHTPGNETVRTEQPKAVSVPKDSPSPVVSGLPAGGKLASRLNPNLAAMLSRGNSPRPLTGSSSPSEQEIDSVSRPLPIRQATEEESTSGELTHMTKGRARGPKRRAPKSQATDASKQSTPSKMSAIKVASNSAPDVTTTTSLKEKVTPKPVHQDIPIKRELPMISKKEDSTRRPDTDLNDVEVKMRPKPLVVSKSPDLRRVSSNASASAVTESPNKRANSTKFEITADKGVSTATSTPPQAPEKPSSPNPIQNTQPLTPNKSRVNTSKPSPSPLDPPVKPQSPKPVSAQLSAQLSSAKPLVREKPAERIREPIVPVNDSKQTTGATLKQPGAAGTEECKRVLSSYCPNLSKDQPSGEFDAPGLLSAGKDGNEKIKSISHSIWELDGGGKKMTMPPQQEHILYEESMYLLVHTFELGTNNKISEVSLWCGDQVADAAIEDAQLFCRKEARENNAKLEIIRQGRESSRFFQALGGILIVRRSKSSSMYMLCGRRHLGHIAFDEVDIDADNLCSGFVYLISAKFGKLFMWKGKGSGADEVGCARLIGMDLGLTGEIEEIVEGEETSSFWEGFPRPKRTRQWSSDWSERAEHDCYPSTLYRVEMDRPKSAGGFWGLRAAAAPKPSNKAAIETLNAFSHRDLDPNSICILDAYRSVYVIVGSRASDKDMEVMTGFHLAQELAVLSPSIQGRSLMPNCFVVFGEPSHDIKACFRKWPASYQLGSDKASTVVRLEDVMEALEL